MKAMFSGISWQAYLIFIVTTTLLYYLIVYLLYFKNFFKTSVQQNTVNSPSQFFSSSKEKNEQQSLFEADDSQFRESEKESEEHLVYACMDELNAFLENQKRTKVIKPELIQGLYLILQKYPLLRHSNYRKSLCNVIATQSENICSIHLSAEELKGVWFG